MLLKGRRLLDSKMQQLRRCEEGSGFYPHEKSWGWLRVQQLRRCVEGLGVGVPHE